MSPPKRSIGIDTELSVRYLRRTLRTREMADEEEDDDDDEEDEEPATPTRIAWSRTASQAP